jgi:hypothetical protein
MVHSALSISIRLYLISLSLPAVVLYHTGGFEKEIYYGAHIIFTGWMAPFAGEPQFAWFANLALFRSWNHISNGRWRKAKYFSAIALVISLNTFIWFRLPLPADEGGVTHTFLMYPYSGFAAWLVSMAIIFIASSRMDQQVGSLK